MSYQYHRMSNGIGIIFRHSTSDVAHLGIMINAGSRDEQDNEHGIAHFIEHMAFKGTTHRKAFHILNRLDSVGGDLNAYTSKEQTCLYASFLSEFTQRSVELFADIVLNSVFPIKEMEKEKSIILDEINSYKDSPSESIFDDFEELIFGSHPLARNILGSPESIAKLTRLNIIRFAQRNYSASETVISYIGNMESHRLISLLEHYFLPMHGHQYKRERISFDSYSPEKRSVEKDTHQTHIIIGSPAYATHHPNKTVMHLLNNILGGPGSNSRLNMALRERRGYTYHVESNYQPFSDTGYFSVYMGTTSAHPQNTIKQAMKELEKMRTTAMGTQQLHYAKKQLAGQIALAYESCQNEMLSMGKRFLEGVEMLDAAALMKNIESVTASQLLAVANDIFDPEKFSTLIYPANPDHDE